MIHVDPALIAPDPTPASAPAAAPATARALIEEQMVMLSRLAQIGMGIAEACGRQAAANTAPETAEPMAGRDPGLAFARVARAVRMTIALQSRLAKDLAALDRADENAEATRRSRRRMRLSRLVDDAARAQVAARREAGGQYWADEDAIEDEIEQLSCEAYERLTDAEDGDDFLGRPFNEVVAGICADLGLSPDWTARLTATMAPPVDQGLAPASPAPREAPLAARPSGLGHPGSYADPPPPGPVWAPPADPPHPPP